jgi:hypothetical protein
MSVNCAGHLWQGAVKRFRSVLPKDILRSASLMIMTNATDPREDFSFSEQGFLLRSNDEIGTI